MNDLMRFEFQGEEVRTALLEGIPWWVIRDVAERLEYPASSLATVNKLTANVPDEWKGRKPIPTLGGIQEMLCLSEPGLYFFLSRSDKPKALSFQKWIAGEVIPSIRKTGSYSLTGASAELSPRDLSLIRETVQAALLAMLPAAVWPQVQPTVKAARPRLHRIPLTRTECAARLETATYPIGLRRLARLLDLDPQMILRHSKRLGFPRSGYQEREFPKKAARKISDNIQTARANHGRKA